jgi:transcription-repair coupling factor (superfamily II helicase)
MDYKIKLKNIGESCILTKVPADSHGFLATEIAKNFSRNDIVFIAENDGEMEILQKQINFFAPQFEILNFQAWDCLPYDRISPKSSILASRVKALHRLVNRKEGQKFFIITSLNAALQKIVSKSEITNSGLYLQTGSKATISQIAEFLTLKGYRREPCANDAGEFAVRGGIIDIVTQEALEIAGYRIDFFGDVVESIKVFDPITQISSETLRQLEILPASEVILNKQTIENFRKNYRENFGASIDDQLYSAISDGRSYSGMEHWLPFFYNEKLVSIFDYLQNPVCFFSDRIALKVKARDELTNEYYQARVADLKIKNNVIYNPISPQLLYFSENEFFQKLQRDSVTIEFKQFDYSSNNERIIDLELKPTPDFALAGRTNSKDPIELMQNFLTSFAKGGGHTAGVDGGFNIINAEPVALKSPGAARHPLFQRGLLVACLSESFKERMRKAFLDYGIACEEITKFEEIKNIKAGKAAIFVMPTHFGFYASDFFLIGEQAIFGEKIIRRKQSSKVDAKRIIEEGLSIALGELIVHRDHGIGKFDGIHTISTEIVLHTPPSRATSEPTVQKRVDLPLNRGNMPQSQVIKTDMIKILYGGSDVLFVPVDDINLISRYGADNPLIQLDRLGAAAWKNRREKVRKRIKVAAEELLKIAAARHLRKAPRFTVDQHFYDEFKNRFGFVETDDQLRAISEVEEDLEKGSPMDRLICGDVGFGKTEVAMRAAAIVASDKTAGYQIAIIAPTTLLCRQHYKNFITRFEGCGVKVVQLSRLITLAKAKEVRAQIESGEAQIIIGTHSLLQKSIKFKNLALAIVDEEQHFGVAQKERLKEMRNEVHMLTLSATPIPRTLQMSLTGVKDLSIISTPPLDRLAVRNFVMPYDSVIVREAVMREYNRSGRVFFVVPRIRDIEEMEPRLKILLPEIKITHAHGQMSPTQLDSIMNDFVDGKIDMLLSTTIIESGIDISQANCMIIYRSDMFGLSQLYQLRGRVGRGKVRAYCYFMLDNRKKISDDTKKKLDVMQNLDSLGVGFSVASHDMDIRGSGNLLGDEQSGHIKETGVELYQQMLLETIESLKNGEDIKNQKADDLEDDYSIAIKLGVSLLIPEHYMSDLSLRMSFYKKIATISTAQEEENLINEMTDRFGQIPDEVLNLIQVANLKHECKKLGIERLEALKEGIVISFKNNSFQNPDKLLAMIFASNKKVKIHAGSRVLFLGKVDSKEEKFAFGFSIIKKLKELL